MKTVTPQQTNLTHTPLSPGSGLTAAVVLAECNVLLKDTATPIMEVSVLKQVTPYNHKITKPF